jgi:hypothetical protein
MPLTTVQKCKKFYHLFLKKCVAVGRNTLFNSFFQAKIIVLNRFCGNPKSETSKMVVVLLKPNLSNLDKSSYLAP